MSNCRIAVLEDRGVIRITGEDARSFLQGLISNDIDRVADDRAIFAALLTPQGKYLFDFFIAEYDGALLLETERGRIADLLKRLTMYKLRSKADLSDVSDDWRVVACWGADAPQILGLDNTPGAAAAYGSGIGFIDPRLADAGARLIVPPGAALPDAETAEMADYDAHRLALALPDGSRDMVLEKAILMESGFDELNGIDWKKGCYMGQELTARTKYRGLVKKRLVAVNIDGPLPEPGTPVMAGDKTVGEIRSGRGARALALLRLETLDGDGGGLQADGHDVTPDKPAWADI